MKLYPTAFHNALIRFVDYLAQVDEGIYDAQLAMGKKHPVRAVRPVSRCVVIHLSGWLIAVESHHSLDLSKWWWFETLRFFTQVS